MIVTIKFKGVDDWNRPVFKDINSNTYYGSVNILVPDKELIPNNTTKGISEYFKDNIHQLEYFGDHFGCEPNGGLNSNTILNIIV